MSERNEKGSRWLLALLLLVLALITACNPADSAKVSELPATVAPLVTASATIELVEATIPAPATAAMTDTPVLRDPPAFSLVEVPPTVTPLPTVTETAQSEAVAEVQAGPTATATATSTPMPTETASPTPIPTFTPPALPFTSANEHYWLRRPIAEGGTVWTDKSYPYGSTRGGTLRPHHGVEFYVPSGTEVLSAASGTVVMAGSDDDVIYGPHESFYGNLIVIELDTSFLGNPVYNLYAHLSEVLVEEGDHVDAQDLIALSGATGVADGPHLHFEVRVGENEYTSTRNPLLWLYPYPEHGTVAGIVTWPSGELVHEASVFLRRIDAGSKYAETSSYANSNKLLNADEGWAENFAFDDVVAGFYEVEVRRGGKKIREEVWVHERKTSFVEIVLDW